MVVCGDRHPSKHPVSSTSQTLSLSISLSHTHRTTHLYVIPRVQLCPRRQTRLGHAALDLVGQHGQQGGQDFGGCEKTSGGTGGSGGGGGGGSSLRLETLLGRGGEGQALLFLWLVSCV